jgi:hypothetical protein
MHIDSVPSFMTTYNSQALDRVLENELRVPVKPLAVCGSSRYVHCANVIYWIH